ncbi:MBL fold metallo-hydrolase [Aquisediminimonas profunda]|uniref:MBL fold metallo-hydrolase n=1 Tax=Aquisediminimonas profunda TaxID=1550733 RepID=UPI001C6278B0|nr:MBL fold metallo-hydrolase [Aquisediminimonas profunda]
MSEPVSYDASLVHDESYLATSHKGLTYPFGNHAPGSGEITRIAEGICWARIPMPGSLGHINSWLLDDEDGWAVVDTGMQLKTCSDAWKDLFAGALDNARLTRIICTHMHPDHIGLAGWLAKRFDADVWMTRGEWLTARMLIADARDEVPEEAIINQRGAGWGDDVLEETRSKGWGRFSRMVFPMPAGFRRLKDGDTLELGANVWKVVVGSGHSPEHACLYNEMSGVLVSGDQVLPKISSNVSVNISEPMADPLGEWLYSIDKLLNVLPSDLLVCPAHGEPFKGLHVRLRALRDEHLSRLDTLTSHLAEPRRVVDCFSQLFNREIGPEHRELATGEALAHLRRLELEGRVRRETNDGVWWFHAN